MLRRVLHRRLRRGRRNASSARLVRWERLEARLAFAGDLLPETGLGNLAGVVFYDGDSNGRQDATDPGLGGWIVFLDANDNGQLDAGERSAQSDSDGNYLLANVTPGRHLVRQLDRDGWARTVPFADVYTVELEAGQTRRDLWFGDRIADPSLYASISGVVWHDQDRNGTRDAAEPVLSGWQVYLDLNRNHAWDSFEPSTITNAAGRYHFDDLPPVTYVVERVTPAGWESTSPASGGHLVSLREGAEVDPKSFGNVLAQPGRIAGSKWRDLNQNGVVDAGEPPLANWPFYLDENRNGRWDSSELMTYTNAEGRFEFTGVPPGQHAVGELMSTGWTQTSPGPSSGYSANSAWDLTSFPSGGPQRPSTGAAEGTSGVSQASATAGAVVGAIATGDLDGDGDLDVVVTQATSIAVLYNDSNGTWTAQRTLELPDAESAGSIALSDFNGDGRLDVVAGGWGASTTGGAAGRVFVFLNRIGGLAGVPFAAIDAVRPDWLAVGDFDGDSHEDVVAAGRNGGELSWLAGDGTGGLARRIAPNLRLGPGLALDGLEAADFDGDGRFDLAAITHNPLAATPLDLAQVWAWRGASGTGFGSTSMVTLSGWAGDLLATDLDQSGHPELLVLTELAATPTSAAKTVIRSLTLSSGQLLPGAAWTVAGGDLLSFARGQAFVARDLDGDGRVDLAGLDEGKAALWIMPGQATNSFGAPRSISLGDTPIGLVAELLNGDSAVDLVVLQASSSSLSLLLNDGWGGFPSFDRWDTNGNLDQLAALDLDSDGDLDLWGVELATGRLTVALNDGRGRFGTPRTWQVDPNLVAAEMGDVTGDGQADLITLANVANDEAGNPQHEIVVWFGAGGRYRAPALRQSWSGFATAASLADLNADHRLDIVVTFAGSEGSPRLDRRILLGDGTGRFTTPDSLPQRPRETGPRVSFDLDRDGDLDQVWLADEDASPDASESLLFWARNLGDGRMGATRSLTLPVGANQLVAGDLDGDLDFDLLITHEATGRISVVTNQGWDDLTWVKSWTIGGAPQSGAIADWNHDGAIDVAIADRTSNSVRLLGGPAAGAWFDAGDWLQAGDWQLTSPPAQLLTSDWNSDGQLDLAALSDVDGSLAVLLGQGGWNFAVSSVDTTAGAAAVATVGYLDGDDDLDIYVASAISATSGWIELLNDGAGRFVASGTLGIDRQIRDTEIADVTGDGWLDLVSADDFQRTLTIWPGLGTGLFSGPTTTPLEGRPHFIQAGDLDGDQDADLTIGWLDQPGIGVLLNDGIGHFTIGAGQVRGAPPRPYWIDDLDDDGRADLIIPDPTGGFFDYVRGTGDGGFGEPIRFAGAGAGAVTTGDLNGDGNQDLFGVVLGGQIAAYWNGTRPDDESTVTIQPGGSATGLEFINYRTPAAWQNPAVSLDVNNDSFISPIDALFVIDRLNEVGGGELPRLQSGVAPPPYYDPSGDAYIAPNDALLIINYLNSLVDRELGEGENAGGDGQAAPLDLVFSESDQFDATPTADPPGLSSRIARDSEGVNSESRRELRDAAVSSVADELAFWRSRDRRRSSSPARSPESRAPQRLGP